MNLIYPFLIHQASQQVLEGYQVLWGMFSSLWIYADCIRSPSCPSCAWRWFPELVAASPSLGIEANGLQFPGSFFLSFLREEWHKLYPTVGCKEHPFCVQPYRIYIMTIHRVWSFKFVLRHCSKTSTRVYLGASETIILKLLPQNAPDVSQDKRPFHECCLGQSCPSTHRWSGLLCVQLNSQFPQSQWEC